MTRCPYNLDKPCGTPPDPPAVPLEDVIFGAVVGPLALYLPPNSASTIAESITPAVAAAVHHWQNP